VSCTRDGRSLATSERSDWPVARRRPRSQNVPQKETSPRHHVSWAGTSEPLFQWEAATSFPLPTPCRRTANRKTCRTKSAQFLRTLAVLSLLTEDQDARVQRAARCRKPRRSALHLGHRSGPTGPASGQSPTLTLTVHHQS
jgi:hypothetical protein